MRKLLVLLTGVALTAASAAWAHHGATTLTLYRAHCGAVAAVAAQQQAASQVGTVTLDRTANQVTGTTATVQLRIAIALQRGMPNTTYRVLLLRPGCTVQARRGLLTTDANGAGQKLVDLRKVQVPAGRYAVQLLAQTAATTAGRASPADVLTTKFRLVLPALHDVHPTTSHP